MQIKMWIHFPENHVIYKREIFRPWGSQSNLAFKGDYLQKALATNLLETGCVTLKAPEQKIKDCLSQAKYSSAGQIISALQIAFSQMPYHNSDLLRGANTGWKSVRKHVPWLVRMNWLPEDIQRLWKVGYRGHNAYESTDITLTQGSAS